MVNPFKSLIQSRKFWLAVFGVVQTVLFQFVPSFPTEVWVSINVLILAVITGITVEDSSEKRSDTYITAGTVEPPQTPICPEG